MKTFKLIISTPQGNAFEKDISMLSVRGTEGSLAIMANHIPFITTTKDGEVKIIDTLRDFHNQSENLTKMEQKSKNEGCKTDHFKKSGNAQERKGIDSSRACRKAEYHRQSRVEVGNGAIVARFVDNA